MFIVSLSISIAAVFNELALPNIIPNHGKVTPAIFIIDLIDRRNSIASHKDGKLFLTTCSKSSCFCFTTVLHFSIDSIFWTGGSGLLQFFFNLLDLFFAVAVVSVAWVWAWARLGSSG